MYIIVESRTRYVDGFYPSLRAAQDQCRQLWKDFPEGAFFVAKVSYQPVDGGLRLGGSRADDFNSMIKEFGYDS